MAESPVIFEINATSGVPIYRQIVDQVHALVAGELETTDIELRRAEAMAEQFGIPSVKVVAALVLLASFYSIVSGAVDRAARQRVAAADGRAGAALGAPSRQPARASALFASVGN